MSLASLDTPNGNMSAKSGEPQAVDIASLSIPQLNQLSQQLQQDIELFSNSLSQLKVLQGKFGESQEALGKISPESLGKEILVPLTGSMYVGGELSDVEKILIDIGTGYYVEKNVDDGKDYFKRKVEYLTKQMEKIQPLLQDKYRMKQAVMEVLQMKVQGHLMQQQQQSPGASTSK